MARAASQSTIHPLDTMKVRMQAGGLSGAGVFVKGGGSLWGWVGGVWVSAAG
jgi:hypothetical protein